MPRQKTINRDSLRKIPVRFLVTAEERDQIEQMAIEQGLSMSGLVRKLLGLPPRY